jgi:hypothetical protein
MKKRVTIFLAVLFCTAVIKSEQVDRKSPVTVFDAPTQISAYERISQTLELIQNMSQEEIKHPKQAEQFIAISDELRESTIQKIDIDTTFTQSEIENLYQIILQYAELNATMMTELFQARLEEGGMSAATDLLLTKISFESTLSIVEHADYRSQFIKHMLVTPLFVLLPSLVQIKIREQVEFEEFKQANYIGQGGDQYSLINQTLRMNRFIQKFDKPYRPVVELIIRPYMITTQEGE